MQHLGCWHKSFKALRSITLIGNANDCLPADTIKQLQYLVALRDYGHFGKAAESCFVTQSTLSASLRELETWSA
jgi:hypothetical protein